MGATRTLPCMASPEETAFLKAFEEHADALFRHAFFRISERERAKDLTQETFLKAWDYVRAGGNIRHWKSFLYRIMHNLIVDEYRGRGRAESLDALVEEEPVRAQGLIATGGRFEKEEALNEELMIERVKELIPELPDAQRAVISLRYVDGLSPKEIARLLDLSENVVSARLSRAVARLRLWCGPDTI